jgi:hypothetical protein
MTEASLTLPALTKRRVLVRKPKWKVPSSLRLVGYFVLVYVALDVLSGDYLGAAVQSIKAALWFQADYYLKCHHFGRAIAVSGAALTTTAADGLRFA